MEARRVLPVLTLGAAFGLMAWTLTFPTPPEPAKPLPAGWRLVRPPHDVGVLLVEKDIVWAGGEEGLWIVDRRTLAARPALASTEGPRQVRALVRDLDGSLLVGHDKTLTRIVNDRTEDVPIPGLPAGKVLSLLMTRGGTLWAGTEWGAAGRTGGVWRTLRAADGLSSDVVNAMEEDDDGGLWFGSYNVPRGGVTRFHEGRFERFGAAEGLPHASVTSLLRDRESRIWAGTGLLDRGGLAGFEKTAGGWKIARVLGVADGLAGAKVRSLFDDRDGRLWVGSEYEGLARQDASGWKVLRADDGLAHNEVKAIRQDEDGAIWIGTKDGLTVIGRN